jgi:hypothetical protein
MTNTQLAIAFAFLTFAPAAGVFAPAAALAETQDEQNACMNDAFSVCGQDIPDRDKVGACLARNIKRISPECRTVMLRYQKPSVSRAKYSTRD